MSLAAVGKAIGTVLRPGVTAAALLVAAPVLAGFGVHALAGPGWTFIYSGAACLAAGIVLARGLSRG